MLGRKPREDGEGRMDFTRACTAKDFHFEEAMKILETVGNTTQLRF